MKKSRPQVKVCGLTRVDEAVACVEALVQGFGRVRIVGEIEVQVFQLLRALDFTAQQEAGRHGRRVVVGQGIVGLLTTALLSRFPLAAPR